uniref:Major facilitator superfamily (MFS) profile domain-containing protein n=1 Tax=Terrapene triunguis TaxID=2587831 RepID=A0A674JE51_9SAUR
LQLCMEVQIYFYASYIFKQAGIPAEKIPYVTLGTGACECLTALTCGLLIDYMGRRLLIIGGYTLMSFWCIVLTFSLTYQVLRSAHVRHEMQYLYLQTTSQCYHPKFGPLYPWVPYLSMASIFAFILSFGLGPGLENMTYEGRLKNWICLGWRRKDGGT